MRSCLNPKLQIDFSQVIIFDSEDSFLLLFFVCVFISFRELNRNENTFNSFLPRKWKFKMLFLVLPHKKSYLCAYSGNWENENHQCFWSTYFCLLLKAWNRNYAFELSKQNCVCWYVYVRGKNMRVHNKTQFLWLWCQ